MVPVQDESRSVTAARVVRGLTLNVTATFCPTPRVVIVAIDRRYLYS